MIFFFFFLISSCGHNGCNGFPFRPLGVYGVSFPFFTDAPVDGTKTWASMEVFHFPVYVTSMEMNKKMKSCGGPYSCHESWQLLILIWKVWKKSKNKYSEFSSKGVFFLLEKTRAIYEGDDKAKDSYCPHPRCRWTNAPSCRPTSLPSANSFSEKKVTPFWTLACSIPGTRYRAVPALRQ